MDWFWTGFWIAIGGICGGIVASLLILALYITVQLIAGAAELLRSRKHGG